MDGEQTSIVVNDTQHGFLYEGGLPVDEHPITLLGYHQHGVPKLQLGPREVLKRIDQLLLLLLVKVMHQQTVSEAKNHSFVQTLHELHRQRDVGV